MILDIFASHAGSAEGKLQVELAQLEYNLARMRGLWSHLERLGGGIGTRGPGETQIETDRRLARDRIAALRRRLEHVKGTRAVQRAERERAALPTVALVGYTNAGKSTLLNALTGAEVGVRDRLFHTLDPTTRTLRLGGRPYLLTDTVGFISKLPHQLVDAFARDARGDAPRRAAAARARRLGAGEEQAEMMKRAVEETLEEIGAGEQPRAAGAQQGRPARRATRARSCACATPTRCSSARDTGEGLEELGERIERELAPHAARGRAARPLHRRRQPRRAARSRRRDRPARTPPRACACARWCRPSWPSASRASRSPSAVS